jgi:5-methylcytosine-specific restriction endonuclease McrA
MPRNPRRYDLEYKAYDGTPAVRKKRAERNKARREYEAVHGDLPSNMDVDHKKPLAKGGKTTLSNLRAVPASKNRSFPRTKTARMK